MDTYTLNIAACRVNAELTQQELADKLGVNKATISNWESGKTEPSVTNLRKIGEICCFPFERIRLSSDTI